MVINVEDLLPGDLLTDVSLNGHGQFDVVLSATPGDWDEYMNETYYIVTLGYDGRVRRLNKSSQSNILITRVEPHEASKNIPGSSEVPV